MGKKKGMSDMKKGVLLFVGAIIVLALILFVDILQ